MRYLGIDFGTKRVGIALSDEVGTMGFPHAVLPNDPKLLGQVREIAAKENISAIVVGESLNYLGNENPVAKLAKEFADALSTESGLPVFFEPEALSTQEARRAMDGLHPDAVSNTARKVPKGGKGRGAVDASAAALILTSYLSRSHD